ncbi:efflux RND transporter permease subunit [Effusibacillus dendaii]|uniref:Multidrug ABC transporter n=1 Tax=Effusibacillus dendaii TaxID=2743772 RepID=A0A7I8DCK9_9BACL|nr:efflux RND transporter permease subunit [Effusibacillus dendaii]BCJ87814.1 multidrug ABC transporter [Effusibacillus dendaii]
MKIANFSIERPVTISMIMVVLLILGFISIPLLRVDLYPNLQIPVAVVSTSWPGASPDEVEQQISKRIESAMATVPNVKEVDSTSQQGSSRVVVRFNYGVDLQQATNDMRDKLDRVRRQLPTDVDTPTVTRIDPNSAPIITLSLSGNMDPVELNRLANDVLQPRLSRLDGVAAVNITGGKKREIDISLDPGKMQAYGLTINQVTQALQSDNTSADAGSVKQGDREFSLHMNGDFLNVNDIGNVPIRLSSGNQIFLKDIATIQDTFAEVTQLARMNGQTSVSLDITKVSDGNTVQVAQNVRNLIPQLQSMLPKTVKITVVSDQSTFINSSINTVLEHTVMGAGLSIIVLYLFLRRIRTTLVIGVVIPISIISTFSLMYFSNQTINTVTLGGLALGLGSLVDFAVVVIESIFRYRNQGHNAKDAAKLGTAEVGTAVMASALSQIAVFAPIAFTQGLATQLFGPLALTVSFSHVAALFGALTLVPMLASRLLPQVDEEEEDDQKPVKWYNLMAKFQRGIHRLNRWYGRLLKWALGHRKTVISATIAMFVASLAMIPLIGFELTPTTDQGQFRVNIQMATGTQLDTTNKVVMQVESIIQKIPEVTTVFTQVGGGGGAFATASTYRGNISVNLVNKSARTRSTDQVVEEVRQKTANIVGAKINVSAVSSSGRFGRGGAPIQVQITGDDPNVMAKIGDMVIQAVSSVKGTRNVQNSADRQIPQYQMTINRDRASQYGLTVGQIVTAVRTAFQGTTATQFRAADNAIDVIVKYPQDFGKQYENLSRMTVAASNGAQVPLLDVVTVTPGVGPAVINRTNQLRTVTIESDLFNANQGKVQQEIQQKLDELPVPDGYTVSLGGQTNDLNDSFKSLGLAMPLAIVLIYIVMASQFESLFSPFIIMFSLPPTFVGAALGLLLTGRSLSINALTGMIMLLGIVVNNAIVLVDYTNQLRKKGLDRNEAILQAGPVRLRPILMTTATTVLAMLPLVIGFGEGAETQAPMATVVAFGLTFSTMVTLVLVPVVYSLFDDFGKYLSRKFKSIFRRKQPVAETNQSV